MPRHYLAGALLPALPPQPLTILQRKRRARGLAQSDIAALTGADCSTVSLWETGLREPRVEYRRPYSRALGITVAELGKIIYRVSVVTRRPSTPVTKTKGRK